MLTILSKKGLAALGAGVFVAATMSMLPTPASADDFDVQAAPTAAQIKKAVKSCTKQVSNGKYGERAGKPKTVPVCKTKKAIHWRSGMTIDCDGQKTAKCNKSADPNWQNSTSYPQSNGKPLNAEKLPYVVVPGLSSIWKYNKDGITGATVAAVVYKDKVAYAVVGDVGPTGSIGEGSYALAKQLGINPNPRSGGVSGRVVDYVLFPGVKSSPIEKHSSAVSKGEKAAATLVG